MTKPNDSSDIPHDDFFDGSLTATDLIARLIEEALGESRAEEAVAVPSATRGTLGKRLGLLVAAVALATGCGAARPQHTTQQYNAALSLYAQGESLDGIATSLSLDSPNEARTIVREGLMKLTHRYNNE